MRANDSMFAEGCRVTRAGTLRDAVAAFSRSIELDAKRAEAYFRRGVCHYLLGNQRMANRDMDAATVLGCRDAQLWSRYALQQNNDTDEPGSE